LALLLLPGLALAGSRLKAPLPDQLLATHNLWRQAVGVPALRWSDELAGDAQSWADRLGRDSACKMQHSPPELRRETGENLYWASPVRWTSGKLELQPVAGDQVVNAWASERHDYHHGRNACRSGKVCGHYTQVVWRDTREVGCAMQQCVDKSQVWVCRYRPSGNWVGERPY
jgi:pathogenesis-related protein 1